MTAGKACSIDSAYRRAVRLVDHLVDHGPMTAAEAVESLGWTRSQFDAAIKIARTDVCPDVGLALPHPTPGGGWRYQVTDEWGPVEQGAAHTIGLVESRLRSILRDIDVVYVHLTEGSVPWRRATFLRKHLTHITSTLEEISNGEG